MRSIQEIMLKANQVGQVIPAFNVPYLPMVQPIVKAVVDADAFALLEVARPEWMKFGAVSMAAVMEEFTRWAQLDYVRMHLDHIPVIDEDHEPVDYLPMIREAISLGYTSVMVDGSRLSLEDNIAATRQVVEVAHQAGVACEAELGAVMGHEDGPMPPYEELFASGRGFTDVEECRRFARETGCDWLSVAIGNVHGAIAVATRDQKKVEARLNLEHLDVLHRAAGIPLVLHGGSGVQREYVLGATRHGISKINIGTEIRQVYETTQRQGGDLAAAQKAVYDRTGWMLREYFEIAGKRRMVNP